MRLSCFLAALNFFSLPALAVRMRIAVWHNLPSGGGKRALYYHLRGLVARGHAVEIWSPPPPEPEYCPLAAFGPVHAIPLERAVCRVHGPFRAARAYASGVAAQWRAMDVHCRRVAAEIHEGKFDVCLANTSPYVCASPLGRYVRIPAVIYLQEPFRELYEARPWHPFAAIPAPRHKRRLAPRYWRWFVEDLIYVQANRRQIRDERENAAAYQRILVNSYFSRESILRAYGLDAWVCYLGVDADLFKPGNGGRCDYVLGVGAVLWTKGIDRIIRALAAIEPARRPLLLWLGNAADERYQADCLSLAQRLGVRVEFRVMVSDAELVAGMQRARAFIYASRLEPFGFAPLEACACGTPVVAIAEGGVRETIVPGETGVMVDNDDPALFGAAIRRVLMDESLRDQLGRQGRERVVREWTWDKAVGQLERMLNSTITAA